MRSYRTDGTKTFSTVKNGTRYSLKLFPIGGSCAMKGRGYGGIEGPGTFNGARGVGRIGNGGSRTYL